MTDVRRYDLLRIPRRESLSRWSPGPATSRPDEKQSAGARGPAGPGMCPLDRSTSPGWMNATTGFTTAWDAASANTTCHLSGDNTRYPSGTHYVKRSVAGYVPIPRRTRGRVMRLPVSWFREGERDAPSALGGTPR